MSQMKIYYIVELGKYFLNYFYLYAVYSNILLNWPVNNRTFDLIQ